MADAEFDDFGAYGGYPEERRAARRGGDVARRWVNGAGAATSVALIVGLALWGYDLALRDVRGVPVIQALEGPARLAPDDPGGELASYQGLAVNEIAADGTAGDPADRLTLAPRTDELAAEDQPMGVLAASADGPLAAPSEDAAPMLAALSPGDPLAEGSLAGGSLAAEPLPSEPLPDGPAETVAETVAGTVAEDMAAGAIPAGVPGLSQSPRPALRPVLRPAQGSGRGSAQGSAQGSAAPVAASAAAAAADGAEGYDAMAEATTAAVAEALGAQAPVPLDVAPATLAEGTRLVQIGAYPDEARARLEWDKTAVRFGALMDGKRRLIEPAVSAGDTFYRLRVEGFADIEDARRFCEVFKAEGAECVPTAVR